MLDKCSMEHFNVLQMPKYRPIFPVQCTLAHFACVTFTCGVVTLTISETALVDV